MSMFMSIAMQTIHS